MFRHLAAGGLSLLLPGCAVIGIADQYKEEMPGALDALGEVLAAHMSVSRQREMLGWSGSPEAITKADIGTYASFAAMLCDPSGAAKRYGTDVVVGFAQGIKGISKAPPDGLMPALKAINDRN